MTDNKQIENLDDDFDVFVTNSVFPDAKSLFSSGPQSLLGIQNESVIVLDTNVLLVPFTTGKESLEQINQTLRSLVGEERLFIPGQVAREFVKNRAKKLSELYQQLTRKMNDAPQLQKGRYPLLDSLNEYQQVVILEEEIDAKIREYRKVLKSVIEHVRNWIWNDPVSLMYEELFKGDIVFDPEFDQEMVLEKLEKHKIHKLPPGYKDSGKDDKGVGDLLIWQTILEIGKKYKKNVFFVTGDDKTDWWYRSERQSLYPRYELVDEFRRFSDGKLFHMIHFSTLLNLYGASEDVVKEVRQKEAVLPATESDINLTLVAIRRVSGRMLLRDLVKLGVIPNSFVQEFDIFWRTSTYAAHGEPLSINDVKLAQSLAPKLIEFLDEKIQQYSDSPDSNDETNR
jgi:rRNA-processing protein FCF1